MYHVLLLDTSSEWMDVNPWSRDTAGLILIQKFDECLLHLALCWRKHFYISVGHLLLKINTRIVYRCIMCYFWIHPVNRCEPLISGHRRFNSNTQIWWTFTAFGPLLREAVLHKRETFASQNQNMNCVSIMMCCVLLQDTSSAWMDVNPGSRDFSKSIHELYIDEAVSCVTSRYIQWMNGCEPLILGHCSFTSETPH